VSAPKTAIERPEEIDPDIGHPFFARWIFSQFKIASRNDTGNC